MKFNIATWLVIKSQLLGWFCNRTADISKMVEKQWYPEAIQVEVGTLQYLYTYHLLHNTHTV